MTTVIDLRKDKYLAIAEAVTKHAGTLEVPLSTSFSFQFLPDTNAHYHGYHNDLYYYEGGSRWPARTMISFG